ncbi:hypothetical protein D3C72_2327560 [compost metagenome]
MPEVVLTEPVETLFASTQWVGVGAIEVADHARLVLRWDYCTYFPLTILQGVVFGSNPPELIIQVREKFLRLLWWNERVECH